MVQPQAHGDSTLQWEMTGEEAVGASSQGSLMASSQGSLRVPPELAGNEVVHRLLADNNQLREALKRSNDALKDRCEEMEGWQRRSREEREFLACKFREARALVERLAQENQNLLGKLKRSASLTSDEIAGTAETGSQDQNQMGSSTESNGVADSPEALDGPTKKDITEGNTDAQIPPSSLPSKGSNDFLKMLNSHKEKLEGGMKEMRRRNDELEREKAEIEKEREELRLRLSQLSQSAVITEETVQKNAFTVPIERYKELQEKLNILQQNSVQKDRIETLLKQKEKDYVQLTKDIDALRSQVTSLVGELHERQTCLNKCEEEKIRLEEMLGCKTEGLQTLEREMEQQKKQHSVTVDRFLLQTQNLEAALKNERLVIVEEKRKLAQLQHAYTCLFQDYDNKLKTEKQGNQRGGETETLNRLEEAEKALALKQGHIDKLKEEVEQQRALQETIQVLTAQAEIFKLDFQAEREAREKLHQKKEELQEKLSQALTEINLLKQEKMQQRHTDNYRPIPLLVPPAPFPGPVMPQPNRHIPEVQPDYRCPKCQYQAPDMDTLQIHVMDCIQ